MTDAPESCWCPGRPTVVRMPATTPEGDASLLFCRECRYVFSVVSPPQPPPAGGREAP